MVLQTLWIQKCICNNSEVPISFFVQHQLQIFLQLSSVKYVSNGRESSEKFYQLSQVKNEEKFWTLRNDILELLMIHDMMFIYCKWVPTRSVNLHKKQETAIYKTIKSICNNTRHRIHKTENKQSKKTNIKRKLKTYVESLEKHKKKEIIM